MDFKFDDEDEDIFSKNSVTISVNKRNGKKSITSVTGMEKYLDLKKYYHI